MRIASNNFQKSPRHKFWVFPKIGFFSPKSSILQVIGFSRINHPFWGTTVFGNTRMKPLQLRFKPGDVVVFQIEGRVQLASWVFWNLVKDLTMFWGKPGRLLFQALGWFLVTMSLLILVALSQIYVSLHLYSSIVCLPTRNWNMTARTSRSFIECWMYMKQQFLA